MSASRFVSAGGLEDNPAEKNDAWAKAKVRNGGFVVYEEGTN